MGAITVPAATSSCSTSRSVSGNRRCAPISIVDRSPFDSDGVPRLGGVVGRRGTVGSYPFCRAKIRASLGFGAVIRYRGPVPARR
jgi:hypothetical protein